MENCISETTTSILSDLNAVKPLISTSNKNEIKDNPDPLLEEKSKNDFDESQKELINKVNFFDPVMNRETSGIKRKSSKMSIIECDKCKENFTDSSSYLFHRSIHMVGKQSCSWLCSRCDIDFETETKLHTHQFYTHGEVRKFGCPHCILTFRQKGFLKTHLLQVHHQRKLFKCTFCEKCFCRAYDLKVHHNIHLETKKHTCDTCGSKFNNSSNLIRHKRLHEGVKPFICKICKKKYAHSSSLKAHEIIHSIDITCKLCSLHLKSINFLKNHFKSDHKRNLTMKEIYKIINNDSNKKNRFYHCTICGDKFSILKQLTIHLEKNHNIYNKSKIKTDKNNDNEKKNIPLIFSDIRFSDTDNELNNLVVIDIISENISICNVKKHSDINNEKKLQCPKTSKSQNVLEPLIKKITDIKESIADSIPNIKYIELPRIVKKKQKIHLGLKFSCKVCNASFKLQGSLNNHEKIHLSKTFKCLECTKIYKSSTALKQHHRKFHLKELNHQCSYCLKSFYERTALNIHLRTHTKEKPLMCFSCNKGFAHASHLIRHSRRHTGEKPYKCPVCNKGFIQRVSLRKHISKLCTFDKNNGSLPPAVDQILDYKLNNSQACVIEIAAYPD